MSAMTQDAELDHYKRLPIGRLAVQLGAEPKNPKPKPTRGGDIDAENFTLNGWKFQCFQASSGHFMWKSHDGSLSVRGRNSGTIVDIVFELEGSLGKARQRLRGMTGYSPSSPVSTTSGHEELPTVTAPAISSSSRPSVSPSTTASEPLPTPDELEALYESRGPIWRMIDPVPQYLRTRLLGALHPVFHYTFRISKSGHGSTFFPYFRVEGGDWLFSGSERRSVNKDYDKGYDKGGRAGIWTAVLDYPRAIVVTESAIEAMSYARLMVGYDDLGVGFVAVRSGGERDAIAFLSDLIKTKGLRIIVLATNNDSAGMLYAAKIMAGLREYKDVSMRYEAPLHGQGDWNDALKADLIAKRSRNSGSGGPRPEYLEAEKFAVSVDQAAEKPDENSKSPAEFDPRDGIEFN